MEKFIIGLLLLISFNVSAQTDTSKYYESKDYGWIQQRFYPKKVLLLPRDTTFSKFGVAEKSGIVWHGNGSYWTRLGTTELTVLAPLYAYNDTTIAIDTTSSEGVATKWDLSQVSGGGSSTDTANLSYRIDTVSQINLQSVYNNGSRFIKQDTTHFGSYGHVLDSVGNYSIIMQPKFSGTPLADGVFRLYSKAPSGDSLYHNDFVLGQKEFWVQSEMGNIVAGTRSGDGMGKIIISAVDSIYLNRGTYDFDMGAQREPLGANTSDTSNIQILGISKATGALIRYTGFWKQVADAATQWVSAGSNIYFNTGTVSIGTDESLYPLTVHGDGNGIALFEATDYSSTIAIDQRYGGDYLGIYNTHSDQIIADYGIADDTYRYGNGSLKVKVDTVQIDGKFKIPTSAGNGKVLTSDANGVATWQTITDIDNEPIINAMQALGSTIKATTVGVDVSKIAAAQAFNYNTVYYMVTWIPSDTTLTGVTWFQAAQGNYTASGYNGVGLYSYSGGTWTLVASSTDDGNIWKATANTYPTKDFSSAYRATRGVYAIALTWNRSAVTTAPTIARGGVLTNLAVSAIGTNSAKLYSSSSGSSSLPATIAASSQTSVNTPYFLAVY